MKENKIVYIPKNVCCQRITATIEDDNQTIKNIQFENGCPGNLQGISKLVKGMNITDVVTRLSGIRCGQKNTSCPDQLSRMLREYIGGETSDRQ